MLTDDWFSLRFVDGENDLEALLLHFACLEYNFSMPCVNCYSLNAMLRLSQRNKQLSWKCDQLNNVQLCSKMLRYVC